MCQLVLTAEEETLHMHEKVHTRRQIWTAGELERLVVHENGRHYEEISKQ